MTELQLKRYDLDIEEIRARIDATKNALEILKVRLAEEEIVSGTGKKRGRKPSRKPSTSGFAIELKPKGKGKAE